MTKQYDKMCQLKEQKIKYIEAKLNESEKSKKPQKVMSQTKEQNTKLNEANEKVKILQENVENF